MNPELLTIVAIVAWEAIKDGVRITIGHLRKAFKGWVIKDDTCEKVAEVLNNIPAEFKINAKLVEGYLESNSRLIDLLSSLEASGTRNVIQHHSGSGDNVGRDKISYGKDSAT